jgi:hypothetical protein
MDGVVGGQLFFLFSHISHYWRDGHTNIQQTHPSSYKQSSKSKMNKEKKKKEKRKKWASAFCSNQTRSGPGMTTLTLLPLCFPHLT